MGVSSQKADKVYITITKQPVISGEKQPAVEIAFDITETNDFNKLVATAIKKLEEISQ